MINTQQIATVLQLKPSQITEATDLLALELSNSMVKWGIEKPQEEAAFLAQCAHESGGFKITQENLNYSAEGLKKVFGKYFLNNEYPAFAHKPEKIANRVYANRFGNGDEASGDGWAYRGQGLIQLTFLNNYKRYFDAIGLDEHLRNPNKVAHTYRACSAGWFWSSNKCGAALMKNGFDATTKIINGGKHGEVERRAWFKKFCDVIGVS